MATKHFMIITLSLFLLQSAFPSISANEYSYIPEKKIDVVVEGMVYCQSCEYYGTWSLAGAKPIPSAKISVVCKNHKDHVSYYNVFETNANGYFYAELEGFKMSHYILDHPLHACIVKLVSSPLQNCSVPSNINSGLYGSPLSYDNKRIQGKLYEAVIYAAGPLAFRPAQCPARTHY